MFSDIPDHRFQVTFPRIRVGKDRANNVPADYFIRSVTKEILGMAVDRSNTSFRVHAHNDFVGLSDELTVIVFDLQRRLVRMSASLSEFINPMAEFDL